MLTEHEFPVGGALAHGGEVPHARHARLVALAGHRREHADGLAREAYPHVVKLRRLHRKGQRMKRHAWSVRGSKQSFHKLINT
jgi:hypothetical protein